MKTVWITRTNGEKTAEAVTTLGHDPILAPVLDVHYLDADLSAIGYDAIIFTSRNGVDALARLTINRNAIAWCVGSATAEAAREAGFSDVISAAGDAEKLFDKIKGEAPRHSRFLYAAPKEPSAPLSAWLWAEGFKASQVAVYETRILTPAISNNDLGRITHVLIHSARAGKALAAHLCAHGKFAFTNFCFICISEKAWQGFADAVGEQDKSLIDSVKRRISPLPDEPSMLRLLDGDSD
jgi:uroporphyrinogen-III synthase